MEATYLNEDEQPQGTIAKFNTKKIESKAQMNCVILKLRYYSLKSVDKKIKVLETSKGETRK